MVEYELNSNEDIVIPISFETADGCGVRLERD